MKLCRLSKSCRCGCNEGVISHSKNNFHAGKIHCARCDRFLKWISRSEFDRANRLGLVNY